MLEVKLGFHKAYFDQFGIKTKRLVGRMTAQPIIALFFVSWSLNLL